MKNITIRYGNTEDIYENDGIELTLTQYISDVESKNSELKLIFNVGSGIKFGDKDTKAEFAKLLSGYDALKGTGYSESLPSDTGEIFKLIDRFIRLNLNKKILLIVEHAELLLPSKPIDDIDMSEKKVLMCILDWAKNSEDLKNLKVVLISENLSELNNYLIRSDDIEKSEINFPDEEERKKTVRKYVNEFNVKSELTQTNISKVIGGMNRKSIRDIFQSFSGNKMTYKDFSKIKKELIEKENFDFFEFVESDKTLDQVAGSEKQVKRLKEDAELIKKNITDAVPMGYLICGPVGTGKSYMVECFAGEIGIPVVKIKNFRDKYVGQSEANWEKILKTLKSLAPVLVVVDEADAALGNREQEGDSGTSKRIFSSLAQTMGDTANRGKLIWMLLTARPELLPIDLKRQGRAEVHIPLFYPESVDEKKKFFAIISKKTNFDVTSFVELLNDENTKEIRSGADIESVLVNLKRAEYLKGSDLAQEEFLNIVTSFRSSITEEQVQYQTQMALNEVTDKSLI